VANRATFPGSARRVAVVDGEAAAAADSVARGDVTTAKRKATFPGIALKEVAAVAAALSVAAAVVTATTARSRVIWLATAPRSVRAATAADAATAVAAAAMVAVDTVVAAEVAAVAAVALNATDAKNTVTWRAIALSDLSSGKKEPKVDRSQIFCHFF